MHPNVGCGQRDTRRGAGRRLRGPRPDVGPPSEPPERLRERRRAGVGGGAAPALLRPPHVSPDCVPSAAIRLVRLLSGPFSLCALH